MKVSATCLMLFAQPSGVWGKDLGVINPFSASAFEKVGSASRELEKEKKCVDDASFKYFKHKDGCEHVAKKKKKRCKKVIKNEKVKDMCRKTCGTCPKPVKDQCVKKKDAMATVDAFMGAVGGISKAYYGHDGASPPGGPAKTIKEVIDGDTSNEAGCKAAFVVATNALNAAYAYDYGNVLFKPTLTAVPYTYRNTLEGALSYFIGTECLYHAGVYEYPEGNRDGEIFQEYGFAINNFDGKTGWETAFGQEFTYMTSDESQVYCDTALAIGRVCFVPKPFSINPPYNGTLSCVDKTFSFRNSPEKNPLLKALITSHHSSVSVVDNPDPIMYCQHPVLGPGYWMGLDFEPAQLIDFNENITECPKQPLPDIPTTLAAMGMSALVETFTEANLLLFLSADLGNLTVFAPSNDAFDALGEDVLICLLDPDTGRVALQAILLFHVVGIDTSGFNIFNYMTGAIQPLYDGGNLTISTSEAPPGIVIEGPTNSASIIGAEMASNGMIQVIDTVLLPSDIDELLSVFCTAPRPPPVARREEDRVIMAGVLNEKDNVKKLIRQAEGSQEKLLDPPIAVPDPYGWMRDETRENEDVLNHLKSENEYTEQLTQHLDTLRSNLYDEMLSSIKETDFTVPRPKGSYMYYSRTFQGKSYTTYYRAPTVSQQELKDAIDKWDGSAESPILTDEEIILDVNELGKDKKYCSVEVVIVSPSQNKLAYTADFTGDETYGLYVIDLSTKEKTIIDHDPKLEISRTAVWGNDDETLFYIKMDDAYRPYQVYQRKLTSSAEENNGDDEMLFEENDELYWVGIRKSLDKKYLFVETSSKETSEYHFLDLKEQKGLQCLAKKRSKVLYGVEHRNGYWWISTNVNGTPNMKLMVSPAVANCEDQWTIVTNTNGEKLFEGDNERSLDWLETFQSHIVASGREGGIPRVWIISPTDDGDEENVVDKMEMLTFEEEAHYVGLDSHSEFDTDTIVVSYDSMITPPSSIELPLKDPNNMVERKVLKSKFIPNYDKSSYGCDRTTVKSRDGKTDIPVSLVYRKDLMDEHLSSGKTLHTHLYGYGSYGYSMEADFSVTRLPLLNRGIVYVIAHVRGGGEMGRSWYEEPNGAKYLCKKNTFNDFVDVARWLVDDKKLTTPSKLSTEGRSAGGLLIGATINQAPELFKVAILGVPFVDVVPTMIDSSIPLTVVEWEEWGNPNEEKFFQYMMEYSPINNVQKDAIYPSCLLTGGLYDPRVQYWEPSKFAAELRHSSNSEKSGPVCLKMDMSSGHFSASDRYKYFRGLAFDYAFLLDQVGLSSSSSSSK